VCHCPPVVYFLHILFTQAIEEPFVTAVKEAFGDRLRPTMDVVYRKTIRFILTILTTGFMYHDVEDAAEIR